jgi:hypothetical protein
MVSNRTEVNIAINIPYTEIKNMILSWSPHYILIVLVQLFVSYRVSFVNRITTRRISSSFMRFTQLNKGNNKTTELRAILQRESQNS